MLPDIIFLWSQGKNLLQTCFRSFQLTFFNPNNTKVVPGLNMAWISLQDPKVAALGKVKVSDMVGVDVPQQDEAFHMIRVVLKQLLQRSNSLKRSVLVSKQQSEVEEGASEILLQNNRFLEPAFSFFQIAIVPM